MDVTVCIGTFGDPTWIETAKRAVASVPNNVPVIHEHGDTLATARNAALAQVRTEWTCFLDADDELEPGYFDAMFNGTADVRGPIARYMVGGRERNLWRPRVWRHEHDCTAECLRHGNFILIGAMARTEIAQQATWREFPWSEDWDFWIQCWKLGATFETITGAIYRAHVRSDSRNRGATQRSKDAAHRAIYEANFGAEAA